MRIPVVPQEQVQSTTAHQIVVSRTTTTWGGGHPKPIFLFFPSFEVKVGGIQHEAGVAQAMDRLSPVDGSRQGMGFRVQLMDGRC